MGSTPPFSLNTTAPADNDVTSQFPLLDRGDKLTISSWLLIDHNVDGSHSASTYPQVGVTLSDGITVVAVPSPSSNRTAVYRDSDGSLKAKRGEDGTIETVQLPPGSIIDYAGSSAPQGWLLCFGQAISRSTFARLFTAIGTTYGAGDGSTTFNIPDLRGRVTVGQDNMGGSAANRVGSVVTDSGTIVGTTLGSTGGSSTHVITLTESASSTNSVIFAASGGFSGGSSVNSVPFSAGTITGTLGPCGACGSQPVYNAGSLFTMSGVVTYPGGNTAHSMLQPSIIVNKIIRT